MYLGYIQTHAQKMKKAILVATEYLEITLRQNKIYVVCSYQIFVYS